jgi:hypothetical protein
MTKPWVQEIELMPSAAEILQIYDAIRPLGEALKMAELEGGVIFTDDSTIPLQVKGNGKV